MNLIQSLLDARERAAANHDWTLVCEIDFALNRNGYAAPVVETAVAPKPERAVRRKPRS